MKKYPKKIKKITYLLSILLFILVTVAPVEATSDFLTEEEKEYISESRVLKAASVRGQLLLHLRILKAKSKEYQNGYWMKFQGPQDWFLTIGCMTLLENFWKVMQI